MKTIESLGGHEMTEKHHQGTRKEAGTRTIDLTEKERKKINRGAGERVE